MPYFKNFGAGNVGVPGQTTRDMIGDTKTRDSDAESNNMANSDWDRSSDEHSLIKCGCGMPSAY